MTPFFNHARRANLGVLVSFASLSGAALAQPTALGPRPVEPAAPPPLEEEAPALESTPLAPASALSQNNFNAPQAQPAPVDPDDMADLLNSQQQLEQTFTLQRKVDGKVIETEKRTVKFNNRAMHGDVDGRSMREKLLTEFDNELLTRAEALEEAKLDFALADLDQDGMMTAQEFSFLVDSWRANAPQDELTSLPSSAPPQALGPADPAPMIEPSQEDRFASFMAEITATPDAENPRITMNSMTHAEEKFFFMAGAAEAITLEDYVREYLLDFDSMDANSDTLLKRDELDRFRALSRGALANPSPATPQ